MLLRWICACLLALATAPLAAFAQQAAEASAETASAAAERMLAGVGGRAAWEQAHFYRIVAHHYPPLREAGSHINIIEMDMARPRMRFEARGPAIATLRIVDGDQGWRRVDGAFQPMTAEQVASDRSWWDAHVYRMFYRIAVREPGLEARLGPDRRLELWKDSRFVMWYRLGVDGAPYMFGTTTDGARWTLLGPFIQAQVGGVRYPRWTAWSDGTFRTESILFEVAPTAPASVSFRAEGQAAEQR